MRILTPSTLKRKWYNLRGKGVVSKERQLVIQHCHFKGYTYNFKIQCKIIFIFCIVDIFVTEVVSGDSIDVQYYNTK